MITKIVAITAASRESVFLKSSFSFRHRPRSAEKTRIPPVPMGNWTEAGSTVSAIILNKLPIPLHRAKPPCVNTVWVETMGNLRYLSRYQNKGIRREQKVSSRTKLLLLTAKSGFD